jgi:hypothetical protein
MDEQNFLYRSLQCFGRQVKPLASFAIVNTHQSTHDTRGRLWPVLLRVIHKTCAPAVPSMIRSISMNNIISLFHCYLVSYSIGHILSYNSCNNLCVCVIVFRKNAPYYLLITVKMTARDAYWFVANKKKILKNPTQAKLQSSSSAYYSPLLDIGLSNLSPCHSIFDYSHPALASRPAQIVTPPGLRASYTTFTKTRSPLQNSFTPAVIVSTADMASPLPHQHANTVCYVYDFSSLPEHLVSDSIPQRNPEHSSFHSSLSDLKLVDQPCRECPLLSSVCQDCKQKYILKFKKWRPKNTSSRRHLTRKRPHRNQKKQRNTNPYLAQKECSRIDRCDLCIFSHPAINRVVIQSITCVSDNGLRKLFEISIRERVFMIPS